MIYILIWGCLAWSGAVPAAPPPAPAAVRPDPPAPPRLAIEPAGRVDLGELGPLEVKTRAYRFTNTSAAPIRLRVLDRSPGVTVSGPGLGRPIPPGGRAQVVLRVDPAGWTGPQLRNVRLGTDDPRQGNYYLPVRFRVRPDLAVDGPRRSLGDVGAQESPQAVFTFRRETGAPLALRVAEPLPAYLEGEVRAQGALATLAVTFRAARVPPGMALGLERIRVATNVPGQPALDLYLDWRLHHAVEPEPARVVFQDPVPDTRELKLRSWSGEPFRVLSADLEGEGFALGPVPDGAAPEHLLGIRRTAPGPARAVLVLRCTGMAEALRVPLAFLPAAAPDPGDAKVGTEPSP
jgi:hypothetical protein